MGDDSELRGFRANIADAPIAQTFEKLHASLGSMKAPALLHGRFELLLAPHRFSLVKTQGWAEVVNAGIRIGYQLGDMTCSVVSLLPEVEYVSQGRVTFEAAVSSHGETSAVAAIPGNVLPIKGSAQLRATVLADSSVAFRGELATPRISAVGKGAVVLLLQSPTDTLCFLIGFSFPSTYRWALDHLTTAAQARCSARRVQRQHRDGNERPLGRTAAPGSAPAASAILAAPRQPHLS